ncbi:unnamed protein product [Calypogeia fissa]
MEQTAACVINTRAVESSFGLRSCRGNGFSVRSCFPSTNAGAQAACQLVKLAIRRQSPSLESAGVLRAGTDSYISSTAALSKGLSSTNFYAETASLQHVSRGGGRDKDLPVGIWCSSRNHSNSCRAAGRLDSRPVGADHNNHGRGLVGVGNAVALVDKARRNSNSLVLTTDDLPRHSSNFQSSELGLASQKSLVLPEKTSDASRQLCVAVDVDEVLGSFLAALNRFIEETYSVRHDISEYYIYDFMKIWNCSQIEANHRVHAFFDSDHFKNGISPIPGAHQTLLQLASYCQLVVVTSRQHVIRDLTLEWIERHYSGVFKEVHFGNHFALEGPSRRKSEICRSLGANVLIDDNPRYAIDCAECGIEVLLFDFHGSYPWSKTPCGPEHPLITRVKDWKEVQEALLARTCAEL